jgi:hypothetical protein
MDTGEMVDQLIEKALTDYVDSQLAYGSWRKDNVKQALADIIAQRIEERFRSMKPALMAKADAYLDNCQIKASFDYPGIRVEVISPKKEEEDDGA